MASRPTPIRPGRFLPRDPRLDAPYRLTPQLVFRIGILGFLTLAVFAILFFRLWALQVLSGNQYLVAAENNQLRVIRTDAPRGPVEDRYGRVLVDNTSATAVQVWPADLPKHGQYAEMRRLARILEVPLADITREIKKNRGDPVTPVTVRDAVNENEVHYLLEHQSEFPGMTITNTFVRNYPFGALASHILGYVGEISPGQLKSSKGYVLGDKVGQAGIESSFDKELRGQPGLEQLRVDSLGRPISPIEMRTPVTPGYAVRLTLDAKLQQAAQQAIVSGINLAQADHQWYAKAGAIVALDPRDGAIRALASYPTFDPKAFTSHKKGALDFLTNADVAKADDYPALDRAIAGAYPPGSTFKPVTALAAMQEHILSPYNALPCTGSYKVAGQVFNNWDPFVNDVDDAPDRDSPSRATRTSTRWARRSTTCPPTAASRSSAGRRRSASASSRASTSGLRPSGLLPTIAWKHATFTKKTDPCCWQVDRLWKPGDSIQLAIGQKDMLASPLQMARFYALLANGGKLVTPHLVSAIEQPGPSNGLSQGAQVLRRYQAPTKELNLDPGAITAIRDGLYEATHSGLGTSANTFGHYPVAIAGKTGTSETHAESGSYSVKTNTSWWCGFGPFDAPRLVVCAVIENGGFGGAVAAPTALQVFEQFFGKKATNVSTAPTD